MIRLNREAVFRVKNGVIYGLSLFSVLFLPAVFSCGKMDNSGGREVLVVGDRDIGEEELKVELMKAAFELGIPKEGIKQYLNPLLQGVIDIYLIFEYGESNKITLTETEFQTAVKELEADYPDDALKEILLQRFIDYGQWKDEFRRQLLVRKITSSALKNFSPVTVEEIKHYFNTHREDFRHEEMAKVRQIVTATRKEAESALAGLKEGRKWEEVTAAFSIGPESENGGMIGWVSKGVLEESMDKIVFSLPPGRLSSVIKSPYGFHIFEVLEKVPAGEKTLTQAVAEIESRLFQAKKDKNYRKWLQDLRKKWPVKINRELIDKLEFE